MRDIKDMEKPLQSRIEEVIWKNQESRIEDGGAEKPHAERHIKWYIKRIEKEYNIAVHPRTIVRDSVRCQLIII